jgi:hypothetical protein
MQKKESSALSYVAQQYSVLTFRLQRFLPRWLAPNCLTNWVFMQKKNSLVLSVTLLSSISQQYSVLTFRLQRFLPRWLAPNCRTFHFFWVRELP